MQHPFEGVMEVRQEQTGTRTTRRSILGRMLGTLAGLLGIATVATAQARYGRPTTLAYGEEGGRVTTLAYGEEGGRMTTLAYGEEGGWRPPPPPRATTYATGEEGGWPAPLPPEVRPVPPVPPPPPVRPPFAPAYGE
jgi:hypothetical protein